MIFYLIIHVLCAIAAWHLVTANAPTKDLGSLGFAGCLAAVLCFLFGPLALIVVILLMLCQRG